MDSGHSTSGRILFGVVLGALLGVVLSGTSAAFGGTLDEEVFPEPPPGWNRGDPNSTFQHWDEFTVAVTIGDGPSNAPDVASFNPNGTASLVNRESTAFITSTRNIYAHDAPIDIEIVVPNFDGGQPGTTFVLLQTSTQGSDIDVDSVRVAAGAADYSPTQQALLFELNLEGGYGGVYRERKYLFEIPGNDDAYTIRFQGAASSLSLDMAIVDTYWSPDAANPILGDLTGDDLVTRADAALLLRNLGMRPDALGTDGDLDNDGHVSLADLAILQSHLTPASDVSPAPLVAVPEPAGAVLFVFAGACGLGLRFHPRRARARDGARRHPVPIVALPASSATADRALSRAAKRPAPRRAARGGFTLVELLVVMTIIGLLIGMAFPAMYSVVSFSRRVKCGNNLHDIGTAMHHYESAKNRLPPCRVPTTRDDEGLSGSTFVLLLRYLGREDLDEQFDRSRSVSDPKNAAVVDVTLDVFLCPGMSTPQDLRGVGSYAVCTGSGPARDAFKRVGHTLVPNPDSHNGAVIEPARGKTSIAAVNAADGARNTFLVGELDFGLVGADERSNGLISGGGSGRWAVAYPGVTLASTAGVYNAKQLITGFREWETFRSDHERGCNFVMVDGSVRFVTDDVDARVLDALATRDGDDDVPIELE